MASPHTLPALDFSWSLSQTHLELKEPPPIPKCSFDTSLES